MAFSQSTKQSALQRAGNECEKCGKHSYNGNLEFHHVNHVASGGSNALSNCRVLCVPCHDKLHN